MYYNEYEKFLFKKIDPFKSMNHEMKKYFIIKNVNNLCTTLRKNEYRINIENDLSENILPHHDWKSNLDIVSLCYFLMCVDVRNSKYSSYYNILYEKPIEKAIVQYKGFFEEIYDRLTFYYRVMNSKKYLMFNNIHVINVVKHNHCVEYVLKKYRNILPTILMFDSHRDLSGINSKRIIQNYYDECNNETLKLNQSFYESIPFIGQVLYPIVMPFNTNNGIIHIAPQWCNVEETDELLYFDADIDNNNNSFYSDDIYYVKNIPKYMKNIKDISYSTCYINTLIHNIDKYTITDEFILNIDLDYFCTNGTEESNNIPLDTNINDPKSHKRTMFDDSFVKDLSYYELCTNNLSEEMEEIRGRIKDFICVCIKLKKIGKQPGLIIFSDSTLLYFSHDHVINNDYSIMESCSNGFTPKYLILWLKTTLYNHLKHIYSNDNL